MDWTVYEGTPIANLPRPLRYPALLLRNLLNLVGVARPRPARDPPTSPYIYEADGLATVHFTPFLDDPAWSRAYEEMARDWYPDQRGFDIRWRMWVLTSVARQVRELPGDVVEFGVYRAGCAQMVLGTVGLREGGRYHLFDTFAGIPDRELTAREQEEGYAGRLGDTSVEHVRERLDRWEESLVFHVGDVFDTIPDADTGDLSLVHMDLNASAPTKVALEFAYPRLVPGGVIVFDDYGWDPTGYEQRDVIHDFCARVPEDLLALPTGQALLTKLP